MKAARRSSLILASVFFMLFCACTGTGDSTEEQCIVPNSPALEDYAKTCVTDNDCVLVVVPYCSQSCGSCGDAVVSVEERTRFIEEHALTNYVPPTDVSCGACNCIEVSCVEGTCVMAEIDAPDENTRCSTAE